MFESFTENLSHYSIGWLRCGCKNRRLLSAFFFLFALNEWSLLRGSCEKESMVDWSFHCWLNIIENSCPVWEWFSCFRRWNFSNISLTTKKKKVVIWNKKWHESSSVLPLASCHLITILQHNKNYVCWRYI